MTVIATIAVAMALASTSPSRATDSWELLYTVPDQRIAFDAVYAAGRDAWVAGGPGVVVIQSDGVAQMHKVDRDVSYISGTPFGVHAVGSRGTVWSIRAGTLREEHYLPGPRKVRDPLTLDWLAAATIGGKQGVVAFGPELMLFGPGDGTWSRVADTDAASLRKVLVYERGVDVKGCGGRTWIPLRDGTDSGFLACDDRRTYVGRSALQSHPRLPTDCPRPYSAARLAESTVVVCDYRKSWLLVETSDGWSKKTAPMGMVQVHTAGTCILAATARSVWRTCSGLIPAPTTRK